jgi:hypothetical protein
MKQFCQRPPLGPDESYNVESESLRPDRKATVAGSEIVGHLTRESFMAATGRPRPGTIDAPPIPEGIPADVARAGLRKVWPSC